MRAVNRTASITLLFIMAGCASAPVAPASAPASAPVAQAAPAADPARPSPFAQTYQGWVARTGKQLIALTEAFDDAQLAYRPAEGVRSTEEVIVHAAGTLYMLGTMLGVPAPAEADMLKAVKGKTAAIDGLRKALVHANEVLAQQTEASLAADVDLFGHKAIGRDVATLMVAHTSEHLGQLIAYARANGVVPPWSRKG